MKSYRVLPMFNIFVSHLPCWGQSLLIQNYKIFLMLVHDLPPGPARYAVLECPVQKDVWNVLYLFAGACQHWQGRSGSGLLLQKLPEENEDWGLIYLMRCFEYFILIVPLQIHLQQSLNRTMRSSFVVGRMFNNCQFWQESSCYSLLQK